MSIKIPTKLHELVIDLYWEYDRMSSSGQESLDEIAKIIKVPTQKETQKELDDSYNINIQTQSKNITRTKKLKSFLK